MECQLIPSLFALILNENHLVLFLESEITIAIGRCRLYGSSRCTVCKWHVVPIIEFYNYAFRNRAHCIRITVTPIRQRCNGKLFEVENFKCILSAIAHLHTHTRHTSDVGQWPPNAVWRQPKQRGRQRRRQHRWKVNMQRKFRWFSFNAFVAIVHTPHYSAAAVLLIFWWMRKTFSILPTRIVFTLWIRRRCAMNDVCSLHLCLIVENVE